MQVETRRKKSSGLCSYFGRNSENFYFDKIDEHMYVISLFQAMLEKQEINGGKFRKKIPATLLTLTT